MPAAPGDETSWVSELALVLPLPEPELHHLSLVALRTHRTELLAECARAARWRRLVQARLDLAVDQAAPVEDLHGLCAQLREVVGGAGGASVVDRVEQLRRVEAARSALAAYTRDLQVGLAAATDELVERYAQEPGSCLGALG